MKQRSWTFFKVTLYLGLVLAISVSGILVYFIFFKYRSMQKEEIVYYVLLGALFQTIFYILNIRLVHFYSPNQLLPGKLFQIGHLILLVFNSCIAVGALIIFVFGFSDTYLRKTYRPATEDIIAMCIIAVYTFITFYTSTAAIIMRRYLKYQADFEEEKLLNQLGSSSMNS